MIELEASRLRHPQPATDQGGPDQQENANIRACQLLLGHRELESTVRYLGIEVDDALAMSEQTDL